MDKSFVSRIIVPWHDKNGRKNLPWQVPNSYYVWVSEIMLQQTQVLKVIDFFNNFIQSFPTLEKLSQANVDDVLSHWSGLGYYNRARNIYKTAQICIEKHQGELPQSLDELMALPGIGRTTAGAILSLASNKPYPILDGNVKRVMSRIFMIKAENPSQLMKKLWEKVEWLMPSKDSQKYNQALMDLGSLVCKRSQPLCLQCPFSKTCKAYLADKIYLFPQKTKKVKQVELTMHALMIIDDDSVYLQKRKENGIWPQLWFLPLFETDDALMTQVQELKTSIVSKYSVQHILTHRKLDIQVNVVKLKNLSLTVGQWHKRSSIKSLPHPIALQKIMKSSNMY
jgi:A/G-specific adenine glycosylase